MASVPLFGVGTTGKSPNVSAQRRINMYAEAFGNGQDDKSPLVFYPRPGLVPALVGAAAPYSPGPPRELIVWKFPSSMSFASSYTGDEIFFAALDRCFGKCLNGTTFDWSLSLPGFYGVGGILTGAGRFRSATSGDSVLSVDGVSAYVTGDTGGGYNAFTNIGDSSAGTAYTPTFPFGATSVCFIAGRYVVNDPRYVGRFWWSELLPNYYQANSWPGLNYATAESVPDALSAVVENAGELLLFGSKSLEFWQPTGGDDVFARVGATNVDWGCLAPDTIRRTSAGLMFLGFNTSGKRQVCALSGYSVQVVSTPDVESSIDADPNITDNANYALTFTVAGHSFYVLNLTNTSWAYNITTGEWSEWQTEGSRWAGQCCATYLGTLYVSDYRQPKLYTLDQNAFTDNGQPIVKEIQTRHVAVDLERITVDHVALDAQAGVGLSTGQGSDPQVMLQYSKDGGHTWSSEMWETLGALGEYGKRVVWNRLGRARDWVFRFRITDSVKVVLIGAAMRIRK